MNSQLLSILQKYSSEVMLILKGDKDLLDYYYTLYYELYEYFLPEMPYGTAKARDGDPIEWISEKLFETLVAEF